MIEWIDPLSSPICKRINPFNYQPNNEWASNVTRSNSDPLYASFIDEWCG